VAGPLLVLALNLGAALLVHPRFRRQAGLLCFHVALLAVLVLGALEQLRRFDGRVELLVGEAFDPGNVQVRAAGPLYGDARLDPVRFRQGHFSVEYAPQLTRRETRSLVYLPGRETPVIVGDTRPLSMGGYHFHTTSNKGYAALLRWEGADGAMAVGAVHFPSYPLRDWEQVNRWTTPVGEELALELILPEAAPDTRTWRLDSRRAADLPASLGVSRDGGEGRVARGDWVPVAGGRLRFEGLRMWMGYQVSFNPLLAWLLAAGGVGVAGLAWHFWVKLWSRPLPDAAAPVSKEERDGAVAHP
jgi:cytochrome c biogenesis protein